MAGFELDETLFSELRLRLGLDRNESVSLQVQEDDSKSLYERHPDILLGDLRISCGHEPNNVEAEAALLGALMIDNRLVDQVDRLQPNHFAVAVHARIFTAIRDRVARNQVANPVTLRPLFENDEGLSEAGGATYLAQLTGSGVALIGARDFAAQITDLWTLRGLRASLREGIARAGGHEDVRPEEIVADLETELAKRLVEPAVRRTVTLAESFRESLAEMERVSAGEEPSGFKIHRYTDWNAVCGRMEGGDFILLGARPSMGKTGVGATVALGAAEAGIGTDFLSLEMDRRKATRRVIAEILYDIDDPLPYQNLVEGKLSRAQWRRLMEAQEAIATLPLTISDPPSMAVEDVGPHIRRRKREFEKRGVKMRLCVLDYLGRLQTRQRLQGTTETVSFISRTLKAVAKEEDVALVALAQLSRGLEQRENKRPMLADLRDSGSLEQDADTVIFLYRDAYYHERQEPKRNTEKWAAWADELAAMRDDLDIYSGKRREGELTKRTSKFLLKYQAVLDHHDPRVAGAPGLFDD